MRLLPLIVVTPRIKSPLYIDLELWGVSTKIQVYFTSRTLVFTNWHCCKLTFIQIHTNWQIDIAIGGDFCCDFAATSYRPCKLLAIQIAFSSQLKSLFCSCRDVIGMFTIAKTKAKNVEMKMPVFFLKYLIYCRRSALVSTLQHWLIIRTKQSS